MNRFFRVTSERIESAMEITRRSSLRRGFDTATEVAPAWCGRKRRPPEGLPFWAILSLPVLYHAGMALSEHN